MSTRDRFLLRVAALWTVFVWLVFTKNILGDTKHHFSAGFKAVHVGLAVVSIALGGVVVWAVASRSRAPERARD